MVADRAIWGRFLVRCRLAVAAFLGSLLVAAMAAPLARATFVPSDFAGPVGSNYAMFHGLVETNGEDVRECHFDYGLTPPPELQLEAACQPAFISGFEAGREVTAYVTGLQPGTTYHMHLFASPANGNPPGIGPDETFTTAPASAPAPAPTPTPAPAPPLTPAPTPRCAVPRLKGRTLAQAKSLLSKAKCALGHVKKPRHSRRRLVVVRQSVPAGSNVPAGTAVAVTLH